LLALADVTPLLIEHIRKNKWKAKWIEPNPGLIDYIESGQLIVPWKERKAFLKEQESAERLRNRNRALGYAEESPVAKALYGIFENVGDEVSFYRGFCAAEPAAVPASVESTEREWSQDARRPGEEYMAKLLMTNIVQLGLWFGTGQGTTRRSPRGRNKSRN